MPQIELFPADLKRNKRFIDRNKPNYAFVLRLTCEGGAQRMVTRISRRRSVQKVLDEVSRTTKGFVSGELVRSLTYGEFEQSPSMKARKRRKPIEYASDQERRVSTALYLLAVKVAALEGRNTSCSTEELIRPVLEATLAELARKILTA